MHVQFVKDLRLDDNPNIHELRFVAAEARSGANLFDANAMSWVNRANYTVYINNQKTSQVLDSLSFGANDEVAIVADKSVFFPILSQERYLSTNKNYYRHIKSALPTMSLNGTSPVDSLDSIFYNAGNLTSISPDLFASNTLVTMFMGTFWNCASLTSIPETLFASNTSVTHFIYTFTNCTSLTSIPQNLFASNTSATYFTTVFSNCTALTSIPPNLFANNTLATTFTYTFSGCTALTAIPGNLFAYNNLANDFYSTFWGCSNVTGNLPELWAKYPNARHDSCFSGCTRASNYATALAVGWAYK